MTREERISYWRNQVEKQADSGLIATVFCRDNHIKLSQFYRWRRRFCTQAFNNDVSSSGFLELVPSLGHPPSGVRIRLDNKLCIEVDRGFDSFTLRAAVETLYSRGSKPCSP
jgi:hypothetical protein